MMPWIRQNFSLIRLVRISKAQGMTDCKQRRQTSATKRATKISPKPTSSEWNEWVHSYRIGQGEE